MAYSKTKWVNNQTKLSATNLNHMEQGILDAHDLVDEAKRDAAEARETGLEAQVLAREAQDAIEHIDLSSKQDVLESGVNIKTINGQEILGSGDLVIKEDEDINYQELPDGTSLDSIIETGIYSLKHANNFPVGTDEEGTLTVTKLNDQKVEQEWKSKVNNAQRILEIGKGSGNLFKVNGEIRPQGIVRLSAGNTYELEGNLIGNVIIEGASSTLNRTKLILKGVNIQSDEAESIINYTPEVSKLVVEVANNTENYLVCNIEEETGQDDLGVIHSENNLMLTGVGYLTIVNKKGHGIKASELIIDGDVHMYLDTNHDAIHGGKLLKITGGEFYVNNANDAFSASEGGSGTGKLLIYGGKYNIRACKEAAFEGKSPNGVKRILNANITFGEGVNKLFNASNASSDAYKVKVYQGLNTIENNSGKTYTEVDMADDFIGEPTIVFGGEVNIEPVSGVFTLNQPGDYKLSGNFSNYRIISAPPAGDNKMNLILDNVYYNNETEAMPFIEHTSADKRIKFDSESKDFLGKLCYIRKAQGDIIKSGKNIQFDGKTDVIIDGCGTAACGLRTPNGYVALLNDSLRSIRNCTYGIEADNVRLGKDPDDVLDGKYTTGDAEIYLLNNELDIKLTKQGAYEQYHSLVVAPQYHTGISIIGQVAGNDLRIEAQSGLIQGANYTNSAILYLESASGTQTNVNRYNPPVGVKPEVPSIDPSESSTWNVYKGDGYSQSEADNRFVAKDVYNALKAELEIRAPKKIDIVNYVEDSSKDDHRPAKEAAYSDGKIDAIEIFRYACPERIDIDSTVDVDGNEVEEPETHLSYFKDGRQIYARDGDFGYPEIDRTGQFNFRPVFNKNYKTGYVLQPIVTDSEGNPHDDKNNPCYNNFKTPWLTGIDGLYRFTKVCKDIKVDMQAVLESELPSFAITYKIIAPADYDVTKIPSIRIFRCSDQAEKYYKYYLHPEKYETLNPDLMKGQVLEFVKQETAEGEDQVWEASGISYDDSTGYPSNNKAKVTFLVETDNLEEGYSATPSATGKFKNLNAGDFGHTKVLTSITGAVTVTVRVAPPVEVSYDDQGYTRVDSKNKVLYGFDPEKTPASASQYSPFRFTIIHGKEYSNSRIAEDGTKIVIKDDGSDFTVADAAALIDGITIGGEAINVLESISITPLSFTKKKVTVELDGDVITGDVVIKLAAEAE